MVIHLKRTIITRGPEMNKFSIKYTSDLIILPRVELELNPYGCATSTEQSTESSEPSRSPTFSLLFSKTKEWLRFSKYPYISGFPGERSVQAHKRKYVHWTEN